MTPTETPTPFPRTFWVGNAIELFERWAFYGLYVVLSLHLTTAVGLTDAAAGDVMGLYAFFRMGPILGGILADRIGYRRGLVVSMLVYAIGYAVLGVAHDGGTARIAIVLIGLAGALFKPIITATVARTPPPERRTEGFAIFYRIVNAGSVVGKLLTNRIRVLGALSLVVWNSVAASLIGFLLAAFVFREPEPDPEAKAVSEKSSVTESLAVLAKALLDVRFSGALLILSGFYFMSEQFYQTFPKYVTRHIDANAPLEFITLLNPATIALFQGVVTRATKSLAPLTAMVLAVFVGACSMLLMGALPGVLGACISFAVFGFAEMIFAPRFYEYVARFAPKGREGAFMGLTVLPVALGGMIGGMVSGRLIERYLPADGDRSPFMIWSIYAACGLASAVLMLVYERFARTPAASAER